MNCSQTQQCFAPQTTVSQDLDQDTSGDLLSRYYPQDGEQCAQTSTNGFITRGGDNQSLGCTGTSSDQASEAVGSKSGAPSNTSLMLHPFTSGATKLTTTELLNSYPDSLTYGNPKGIFVSPTNEIDALLQRAKSTSDIEKALGLDPGLLQGGDLVRIDISNPFDQNLRRPDANLGNAYHLPGLGFTTGGITEAMIDGPSIYDPSVRKTIIERPKG